MSHTRIPSPTRSQGAALTPRRDRSRRTRSVGSPARSNASGRLSTLIQEYREKNMQSFVLSPLVGRSLLTDNTDIEEPRRKSWWKKLDENSRDVMEILEENQRIEPNNIIEELDIEILSQENKKNYTLDMPESSGSESINSIVIPQRKLFTQKEKQHQKKFAEIVGTRDTLTKLHKTHAEDEAVNVEPRELFQNKQRSKPIFPAALLNISPNKTTGDKTREFTAIEPKGRVRNIFGNRQGTKRKNMFANFVVSESEDEIPEIQPKVFGFHKKPDSKRHDSLSFRGHRDPSPTSSITTEMEFDEWRLLPSSTMVENQLEIMVTDGQTPKRARLSKLSEIRESVAGTNSDATDRTKQSNKSTSSKNKSKTKKSPESNKSVSNKNKSKIIQKDDEELLDKPQHKSKAISPNTNDNISNSSILTRSRNKVDKQNESINKSRNSANKLENTSKKISQKQNMANVEKQQESKEHTSKENLETYSDEHNNDEQNFTLEYETDDNEVEMAEVNQQKQSVINKSKKEANASKTVLEKEADSRNNSTGNINGSNKKFRNTKSNKIVEESTEEPSTDNEKINMSKDQQNTSQTNDSDEKMVETDEEIQETSKENNEAVISDAQIENDKQEENMEVDENAGMKSQEVRNESQVKVEGNEELNESQQVENKTEESNESQEENDDQKDENKKMGNETEERNESYEIEQENDDQKDENQELVNETAENNESQEIYQENESQTNKNYDEQENDDQQVGKNEEIDNSQEILNKSDQVEEEIEESNEDVSHEIEQESDNEQNESQEIDNESENEYNESQEVENEDENQEEELNESQEEQNESQEVQNETEENASEAEMETEDQNESQEEQNESQEVQNETEENASEAEMETEDQNESQEEQNESQEDNESEVEMETEEQNESQEVVNESQEAESEDEEHNVSQEVVNESDEMESDKDGNYSSDQNAEGIDEDDDNHKQNNEEIEEVETETSNESHDTTGRNRKKDESPEVILHDATNQMESFAVRGRNTSIRKTKSMINPLNIRPRPSLALARESTGFSDGTKNSSVEGSGWDSHRTTRKTLRQTFGKDFTPRKSLRTLVMEKSAKRQTVANDLASVTAKFPQANSTELPEVSSNRDDFVEEIQESDHEVSRRTRLTTLETYLQNIQKKNMEEKLKIKEAVLNSLKAPSKENMNPFKVPAIPMSLRRTIKPQTKQKSKKKTVISLEYLPKELIEDMQYKPPKRFQPRNAPWVTKRLYKYLETKLEPRYDYRARVRAEKLVETIYNFAKDLRRHKVASSDAVDVLKHEMARLNVVKSHFEFYEFFHEFLPREVQIKVVPDVINEIPLPRQGIFADILRVNTVQE